MSRAAARSLLLARRVNEEDELRFEARSIVDGSRVDLEALAKRVIAARARVGI
jgi:hypothetical protein